MWAIPTQYAHIALWAIDGYEEHTHMRCWVTIFIGTRVTHNRPYCGDPRFHVGPINNRRLSLPSEQGINQVVLLDSHGQWFLQSGVSSETL